MEDSGFFNNLGKNISDNINNISTGFENKKALSDKKNERDRIYKYIGMDAFNLYKEGKMPKSDLDVHFEKLKTVEMEINRLEKEIEKQKSKGRISCRNCGRELDPGTKYCPICGSPVLQNGQSQNGQMPPYGAGQPAMNYGVPQQSGFDPYTAGQAESGQPGTEQPTVGPTGYGGGSDPDAAIPKVNDMITSGSYPPNSYSQGAVQSSYQGTPQAGYQSDTQTGYQTASQAGFINTEQTGNPAGAQNGYINPEQTGYQTTPQTGYQTASQTASRNGFQSAPQTDYQSAPQGKTCVCGAIIPPGNRLCMQCGRRADVV